MSLLLFALIVLWETALVPLGYRLRAWHYRRQVRLVAARRIR